MALSDLRRSGGAYLVRGHVQQGASGHFYLFLEGVARLPFTARIERAHSYRARSASKKGTWPLPLILPLQSAEEGVPREAQERKAAHFLFLDCGGSDGPNDLHCRIAFNSSNW